LRALSRALLLLLLLLPAHCTHAHDAAKDVHQDGLHVRVAGEDLQRGGHLL
jgi:hypothetical protein